MKNISVRVPEWLFVEVKDFATECGISMGAVIRQLALKRFECGEVMQSVTPSVAPVPQSVTQSSAPVLQSETQSLAPSLDVTVDERAAHAAKRAEADQKRRALFVAMGVTHPADAPLPAKFIPGEADFLKAHPDLA